MEYLDLLYSEYLKNKLTHIFNGSDKTIELKYGIANSYKDNKRHDVGYSFVKTDYSYFLSSPQGITKYKTDYTPASKLKDGRCIIKTPEDKRYLANEKLVQISDCYDEIWDFHDGLAQVCKKVYVPKTDDHPSSVYKLYNYIDKDGNLICRQWYEDARDFSCARAVVCQNGKYNFIDRNGTFSTTNSYDYISDFLCGCAIVKENNPERANLIDTKGKLLSEEWFDDIYPFVGEYAVVRKNGKYNLIDIKGKILNEKWFDYELNFVEGFSIVKREDGKYNFVDKNFNYISQTWYDELGNFEKGLACVKIGSSVNLINTKGELIYKDNCSRMERTYGENIIIYDEEKGYNIIDGRGNLLREEWKTVPFDIVEGFNIVKNSDDKYNFEDIYGKCISKIWFDKVEKFENGIARVSKNGKINYINNKGILLFQDWYTYSKIKDNYIIVGNLDDDKYNIATFNGKFVSKKWYDLDIMRIKYLYDGSIYDEKILNRYLKGYTVKKTFTKYILKSDSEELSFDGEPLAVYGDYVLILKNKFLFLVNTSNNERECIGEAKLDSYNENFIYSENTIYFMYNNQKIDITDYYYNNLNKTHSIDIDSKTKILTRKEFSRLTESEQKDLVTRSEEEIVKIYSKKELDKIKVRTEEEKAFLNKKYKDLLVEIQIKLKQLNEIREKIKDYEPLRVNMDIFVDVDDHKEIMDELKPYLPCIDLSSYYFKNVKMENLDFRGTNINPSHFYPQEFYKKSLKGTDLTGINMPVFMNLQDVDIRGTKFSVDDDPYTMDIMPNFKDSVYDEETTYNGIPVSELVSKRK